VPHTPWGHPDLVLARAVDEGVLLAEDAELIGETRIGGRSLAEVSSEFPHRCGEGRQSEEVQEELRAMMKRSSLCSFRSFFVLPRILDSPVSHYVRTPNSVAWTCLTSAPRRPYTPRTISASARAYSTFVGAIPSAMFTSPK
jgi:hypothetical protein